MHAAKSHLGRNRAAALLLAVLMAGFAWPLLAAERVLIQSTTSTRNSGLYDYLAPLLLAELDLAIDVVAVGTGAALRNAANCDGDLLLVHAPGREADFVDSGFGIERFDLMYNDFVIVGPKQDPAQIAGLSDPALALQRIAAAGGPFLSRGDDSGTHIKELALWHSAGIDPRPASGLWYLETGSGMGPTLNVAAGKDGYLLVDRASWISFANKQNLVLLTQQHPDLFNQYGVILVNPEKCKSSNYKAARKLQDWLLSEAGQQAIAAYRKLNTQLFFPNAAR